MIILLLSIAKSDLWKRNGEQPYPCKVPRYTMNAEKRRDKRITINDEKRSVYLIFIIIIYVLQ